MININGPFLVLLVTLVLLGCLSYFISLIKQDVFFNLLGVILLSIFFFIFGNYNAAGFPLGVNESGPVNLVAGHYYETLAKVPGAEEKKAGEKTKSGLFVIKDGGSENVLLIHIDQEVLPPHFTMDDKKAIIALPAPALTIESPVAPK